MPKGTEAYYRTRLNTYDAIGVREKNAVALVQDVAGMTAQWVLDPTLLLTEADWSRVAQPISLPCTAPFILLYELTPCPYIRQLAHHFRQSTGWPIVRLCKSVYHEDRPDENILSVVDAGPAEFLYMFAHAGLVITNSFHGTAFAVNFQRNFYTVLPLRKKTITGSAACWNFWVLPTGYWWKTTRCQHCAALTMRLSTAACKVSARNPFNSLKQLSMETKRHPALCAPTFARGVRRVPASAHKMPSP